MVGSPLVAATAADMTDTEKIYVYVGSESGYTNGNWYYYDGSIWVSGGVYNSTAFQTDKTLTISGAAADAKVVGDKINAFDEDIFTGTYPDMTVGGLISIEDAIEDQVPYTFRVSGGGVAVGNREIDTLVGGTIVWNQLATYTGSRSKTENGVTITDNNDGTYTAVTDAGGATGNVYIALATIPGIVNHKYLFTSLKSPGSPTTFDAYLISRVTNLHRDFGDGTVYACTETGTISVIPLYVHSGAVITTPIKFVPQVFDLTAMFGSTIADYIYSLETATAGAGVAWFKRLFSNDYYTYDAGSLKSVEGVSAHVMTGFNQISEVLEGYYSQGTGNFVSSARYTATAKMRAIPSMSYYFSVNGQPQAIYLYEWDGSGNYLGRRAINSASLPFTTKENAQYMAVALQAGNLDATNTCVSISSSRNGEYEPYDGHTYPLDSSLTLRGIPKLDSANRLYYDGDRYASNGTVTRMYGIRAYQSGDESDPTVITDMTNTVYKLTTPTTETADPFTNPQIVDNLGTEEYITTGIVPVGHYTQYPTDIVAKVDGLPSDFSTLIAVTETAYKATRAYSVNQFLIVQNQLYLVTASIASGATITPGTNVTAVTIADILTALLNA